MLTFARGTSDVPVTHRVIDVVDESGGLAFETRGDANEGPDPGLVPAANLVGAVALTVPYIGYVIRFAGTQAGFVALVLLPFGLLAVTEVWSIVRDRDERGAVTAAAEEPPSDSDDDPTPTDDLAPTDDIASTDPALASTLLLGALAAWVPASGVLDRDGSVAEPTADDGASEPRTLRPKPLRPKPIRTAPPVRSRARRPPLGAKLAVLLLSAALLLFA
ncbi:peptidase S26B, signal peptidase [Halorubrum lipolyticum DSM 21995]|uniref:Peptidase S26B, signal peptidase n=1 Tax=Halorubrum lipolyticum DSM 21995 TaxID=1227482 RepID=M0NU66_9EURY|nr:peptidase S26B, signal peptidase [Halorubrum lipolyticum DSM 21995]